MGDELNTQAGAEAGAAPTSGTEAGASTEAAATSGATSETTPQISEEVRAFLDSRIEAATQAVIDEYERKDTGHLSRLKSAKDKQIAALQKQIRAQQEARQQQAMELLEEDPAQAAQILAGIVDAQAQYGQQQAAQVEMVNWQARVLADLGADPEEDDEAAALAAEWSERLVEDPNLTWDFQQEAARFQVEREKKAATQAQKELAELKEGMPDLVKAEVTKALVGAGVIPEPTPEGEPAQPTDTDWRKKPTSQLIKDGIAERMKTPIQR